MVEMWVFGVESPISLFPWQTHLAGNIFAHFVSQEVQGKNQTQLPEKKNDHDKTEEDDRELP